MGTDSMISLMVKLITLILIALIVILAFTAMFLGLGYFIIQLFPLSLFEATLLCIAVTTVLMIGLLQVINYLGDGDDLEFDDDSDDD
jgi:hypothetical protein